MEFSLPDSTDSTDTDPKRTQKRAKTEAKWNQNEHKTDTSDRKRTRSDRIRVACDSDGSMSKINGKTNGF